MTSNWYQKRFAAPARETDVPVPYPTAQPQVTPPAAHYQRPAPSSLQVEHCPACNSSNYMSAPGSQYHRCYDCGYPVVQAGTGVGGVSNSSTKTVHKATQVEGSGFNPTVIIGRVE